MRWWVSSTLGAAVSTLAAACFTLVCHASSFRSLVPLVFLGVIVLVAMWFGRAAGMLSTISAALIFAGLLFEPTLSLGVQDPAAKSNLIWMVVGGVAVSELLGPRKREAAASKR